MVATRARWAVDLLDVQPHHHLLEIGCGNGTAVGYVCERLTTGHLYAIDRSASAVARARVRNADHIARGVARVEQIDLADLRVPDGEFDVIYAFNVNLFQTPAEAKHAHAMRRMLRSEGRFVLCYELPSPPRLAERAERVSRTLRTAGLTTEVSRPRQDRLCVSAIRDP